jgi:hypothetical protein
MFLKILIVLQLKEIMILLKKKKKKKENLPKKISKLKRLRNIIIILSKKTLKI